MTGVATEQQRRRAAQDEVIVDALASGLPYAKAGELAGVTSRTVARRMQDPVFTALVSQRRAEHVSQVTGQLVAASADAVTTIHELCLIAGSKPRLSNPQWGAASAKDQATFDRFKLRSHRGFGHAAQPMRSSRRERRY